MTRPLPEVRSDTQRIQIPGDKVQLALTRLVDTGKIDEAARADLWWFYSHIMDRGLSFEAAGREIGKDGSTVYRLLTGSYGALYDSLIEVVRSYRVLAEARGARRQCPFISTSTYGKIETVCRHALVTQSPAFIYGPSQMGKTVCLEEYARRNNHGQTRFIRMPASPTLVKIKHEVARACYLSIALTGDELDRRIFDSISSQMLLIVDEVHQALPPGTRESTAVRIIEWLREVYDRTHCGVVFVGTLVFKKELEEGRLALVLEQFRRRGIVQLVLPNRPPKCDINAFAKAFDLPPPPAGAAADLVDTMLRQ